MPTNFDTGTQPGYGCCCRRKNLAGDVLLTVTAITGTASVAVTQFGDARFVVLCKT